MAFRPLQIGILAFRALQAPALPTLYPGATLGFMANVSGGVPPYTITWNFGDGTTGTGQSVTKTFSQAGTFTVVATVRDSIGNTARASVTITISQPITYSPLTISISPTVSATGQQYVPTATTLTGIQPVTRLAP